MSEQFPDKKLAQTGILSDQPGARVLPARAGKVPDIPEAQAPWRLLVQVSGKIHTTLGIEVKEKILIGRTDPNADQQPELDLNDYGGAESGVSRRHAEISLIEESLYVADLGSTNGTKLNGYTLPPNQRFRLRDGDELQIGEMRLVFRFLR